MGVSHPEVFVASFEDASRACLVDRRLAALEDGGQIAILAAVVISRDADGQVESSLRGGGIDLICSHADTIATMLGIMLPTPILVAGLTAASYEGTDDAEVKREFSERFIREVAGGLGPGSSVFIGVIEDRWVVDVARGLGGYQRLTREAS